MKQAYLTIDDSPSKDFKKKVDYLHKRRIPAIFFIIGKLAEKDKDSLIYAIKKGFIIGNHSYNHPNFSEITIEQSKEQIRKTDKIIEGLYSKSGIKRPIRLFRFPFLNNGDKKEYRKTNWKNKHVKRIQQILRELGYKQPKFKKINYKWFKKAGLDKCLNIDCTYDSFDWCLEEGEGMFSYHDLPTVLSRIDENVPEGGRGLNNPNSNEIIMMHAWIPFKDFKAIIDKLQTKVKFINIPTK